MKEKVFILILATIPSLFYAQKVNDYPLLPKQEPIHVLYLIGDAGSPHAGNRITGNVLNILKRELDTAIEESSRVYLGDNIYPNGMPNEESSNRGISEKALN